MSATDPSPKMPRPWTKVAISIVAAAAALTHAVFPWIAIDLTTSILIVVAVTPWLMAIVKSVELPGGFKIELQDVKTATDTITTPGGKAQAIAAGVTETPVEDEQRVAALQLLQDLSARDPNLALVSMRIEIEKRLRTLADVIGIASDRRSAGQILRELQSREAIQPPEAAGGLNELIALGNQAAHGVQVTPNAASWVIDNAPFILALLDAQIDRARRRA